MTSRRVVALAGAVTLLLVVSGSPAAAKTRKASIGNYYYEDAATKDRKKLVVTKGDQIVFTVVEGIFPPHTVEVDELDIHSGGILQGQTYTTPPLNKVGSFLLYCMPHRDRGHHTRLIVEAPPAPVPKARVKATAAPSSAAPASAAPSADAAAATVLDGEGKVSLPPLVIATAPPAELPSGIGTADPRTLAEAPVDPDSLEGLLGRDFGGQPWTRAVWWLAIAAVPIIGAAAFALRRHARLQLAEAEARRAAQRKKRKPARRKTS